MEQLVTTCDNARMGIDATYPTTSVPTGRSASRTAAHGIRILGEAIREAAMTVARTQAVLRPRRRGPAKEVWAHIACTLAADQVAEGTPWTEAWRETACPPSGLQVGWSEDGLYALVGATGIAGTVAHPPCYIGLDGPWPMIIRSPVVLDTQSGAKGTREADGFTSRIEVE